MAEFNSPYDVGVRALMHVGASIIAQPNAAFPGNAKAVSLLTTAYGKLRRAELQRNIWARATRKTALRPIDANTMLVAPTLWGSGTTYFFGSIVADATGTLWRSRIPNNTGNQPGQAFAAWEPYFGPMSVDLYDSDSNYFSGELVYTAGGDGTYNVYASQVSGNAVHPALPNQWSTDATYFQNQVVQTFPAWSSGATYSAGQTISYTDGNIYASLVGSNTNHTPSTSPTFWAVMPTLTLQTPQVPQSAFPAPTPIMSSPINEWQQQSSYSLGSFAIFKGSVYVSIANANSGNFPNASGSTWWAQSTGGVLSMSMFDLNIGNNPASAPALWASGTTYAINALVGASDGFIYKSLQNSNTANQPAFGASPTWWANTNVALPWTTVFTQGGGNSLWLQIGGASFPSGVGLAQLLVGWPVGSGSASDFATRNVYRLPANYLRRAPQNPKAGITSWLGAPGNEQNNDWTFDGPYLLTMSGAPFVFRFVADVQDVSDFDDMFCEALACRIALEICEPLTQSGAKIQMIGQMYKKFMTEAITVGGIESGIVQPPLEDLIACRL